MVFIGDNTAEGEETVLCPYCGFKNIFHRNKSGEPRIIEKCSHFTSIFMEAIIEKETRYNHYARFRQE